MIDVTRLATRYAYYPDYGAPWERPEATGPMVKIQWGVRFARLLDQLEVDLGRRLHADERRWLTASLPTWAESIIANVEREYAQAWRHWRASQSREARWMLSEASSHRHAGWVLRACRLEALRHLR